MNAPVVGAVVLAAGKSERMGAFKPLLPWGPMRILEAVVSTLMAVPVHHCVVVLGHRARELRPRVKKQGARAVLNKRYDEGMLSSVQCGVAALPEEVGTILVALGDQPEMRPEVVRFLLDTFHASPQTLGVPVYHDRRGHPFLIAAQYRAEILALDSPRGLKELREQHPAEVREIVVDTPTVIQDLDHPEDYQEALARREAGLL